MRVLVACEFSGIVRDAFIAKGHDAVSCDLLPTESPGPHLIGDVRTYLDDLWDMLIAFPPCTYFAKAGMHYLKTQPGRKEKQQESFEFLLNLWNAPINHIGIENPPGWLCTNWIKPHQRIHPYYFGDNEMKETCLWLKQLPPLMLNMIYEKPKPKGYVLRKSGKKKGQRYNYYWRSGKTAKARSKTFGGIANAMAEQWG